MNLSKTGSNAVQPFCHSKTTGERRKLILARREPFLKGEV
jgi:hypothetical protein